MKNATLMRRGAGRAGFTVIELLAVLAVLVLLAMAAIPLFLRLLDQQAREKEQVALQSLAGGFQRYVLRTRTIPSDTNFASTIGPEIGWKTADAQNNSRGAARVILIDPGLHVGQYTNGSPATGGLLPYTQGVTGSKAPLSPRLIIISSVGAALPSTIVGGIPSNTTFTNIWATAPNTKPSLWTWTGNPDDLRIQRINMSQWFNEVSFNRVGSYQGRYSVDNSAVAGAVVPPSVPYSIWLLDSTMVYLWSHSGGSDAITGGLQATETVDSSLSFVYDTGTWRDRLFSTYGARQLLGYDVQAALNTFNAAPENPNAQSGTTKLQVYNYMVAYLTAFGNWAAAGYPNSGSLNSAVLTAQADMAQATARLIKHL